MLQGELFKIFETPKPVKKQPQEWKVISLRECPTPDEMQICETSEQIARYWRMHITTHPFFNPECECLVALLLNTRLGVKGHHFVSVGTLDTILVSPREVFRIAVISAAAKIVLAHNHPSGMAEPSQADIRVTRDLIRAGQILKIELLDHVIIGSGDPGFSSLRNMGYIFE